MLTLIKTNSLLIYKEHTEEGIQDIYLICKGPLNYHQTNLAGLDFKNLVENDVNDEPVRGSVFQNTNSLYIANVSLFNYWALWHSLFHVSI